MFGRSANTRHAYGVYLILSGASSLFFSLVFTVNMIYQATTVGLSPFQLVLVGTVLEVTCFLFEVPTGIVADVYSRRLSVIIGMALIGVGFMVEGALPLFATVLLAQVVWGIGATFISGATDAWIADEIGPAHAGRAYMRGAQVGQLAGIVGIPLSVALASAHIAAPIVLGGALFVALAAFLALTMPENGFKPTPLEERDSWRKMTRTFRDGVRLARARPVLQTILAISAIYGASSEGYDRLWTIHMLEGFTLPALGALQPVVWFGMIQAVGMLLSIFTTELARRRLDLNSHAVVARALALFYAGVAVGTVAFGLAGNFAVALVAFWFVGVMRATSGPIFTAWINQHTERGVRATLLSMSTQSNALGQIAGGPVVGAVGSAFSVRTALALAGLALAPALALYARTARQGSPAVAGVAEVEVAR